jgi:hypothetical protein
LRFEIYDYQVSILDLRLAQAWCPEVVIAVAE